MIVGVRVLWGCIGSRHARFNSFVSAPRATLRHFRLIAAHREPRHLGHNRPGGWMIFALMLCVASLALTGWLYTTDMSWGSDAVETAHRWLAWTLLGLVVVHVAGVLFTSLRQRENLIAAMVTGIKRAPSEDDIVREASGRVSRAAIA